uniref:TFIIS-type domain-containing protein n=1 Tax=viral metagenome TaxID=1070528 RepID=A0A6C0H364_9ZZZZ
MAYRDKGKEALGTILKNEQNIRVIEKKIFDISSKDQESEDKIEKVYKLTIFQIIGDIMNGEKLKDILENIRVEKVDWNHPTFKQMQNMLDEQNDFIENPFAVEEGVLECKARDKNGQVCGSKRVFSYQRQVRSADEPMTTFASCCKCGTKWQYSG